MTLVYTYLFFIRSIFYRLIGSKKGKTALAGKCLFRPTFRKPEASKSDWLVPLRDFKALSKAIFANKRIPLVNADLKSNSLVYAASEAESGQKLDYVRHFGKEDALIYVYRRGLLFSRNTIQSLFNLSFVAIFLLPLIFILMPFTGNKASLSLIQIELLENARLLAICKRYDIRKIYVFCIYEKDSNLCSLILQSKGITVAKISSEVPLSIWNDIIITNDLLLCNRYQFEELPKHSDTMYYNHAEMWGPERCLTVMKRYTEQLKGAEDHSVAFYSTAAWVRKSEGHLDQGVDIEKGEMLVKNAIRNYLGEHVDYSLTIYLHPKEKSVAYLEAARAHYDGIFAGLNYSIAPVDQWSNARFHCENVGVAYYSTTMFERLYFGFKVILMPVEYRDFPLPGTSILNICAFDEKELFGLIDRSIAMDQDAFFKINGLKGYRYFDA